MTMKNRINLFTLLIIFVSLTFYNCPELQHRYIYIKNNSDKPIYSGLSYSYPDTSLKKISQVPGNNGNISHKISTGEQSILPADNFAYNTTMQVFIFDADIIEKQPWDSIMAHYWVLKRYQITESNMEKANWTITYP
jgi:hypothetical protein